MNSIQLTDMARQFVLDKAECEGCSQEEAVFLILNSVAVGHSIIDRAIEEDPGAVLMVKNSKSEAGEFSRGRMQFLEAGECISVIEKAGHRCRIPKIYQSARWHCVLKPCDECGVMAFAFKLPNGKVARFSLSKEDAVVFAKTFQDCLYGKFSVSLTPEGLPLVSVSRWGEEGNVIEQTDALSTKEGGV